MEIQSYILNYKFHNKFNCIDELKIFCFTIIKNTNFWKN